MRVLFLYSEISGYFLSGVRAFIEMTGAKVLIVRWPLNPEAPFKFDKIPGVKYAERKELSDSALEKLVSDFSPNLAYVSGWLDKGYVKMAGKLRKKGIPVICALDNHWRGTIRQRIACLYSKVFLLKNYSHAWVPGVFQYEFARRLGFKPEAILTGMYATDIKPFNEAYLEALPERKKAYPKKLLYVARLVEHKGIRELIDAFLELRKDKQTDWELVVIGAGELKGKLKTGQGITFRDFIQPEELPAFAVTGGAYVLPSRFEPWGVSLHEFAAAGLPLIASDAVGSASEFLINNHNGFIHQAGQKTDLKSVLEKLTNLPEEALLRMGKNSFYLSAGNSSQIWASKLLSVLNREI